MTKRDTASDSDGDKNGGENGGGSLSVKGRVIVMRAPYYAEVVEMLRRGVERAVSAYGAVSMEDAEEDIVVEGALELPLSLSLFVGRCGSSVRASMERGEVGFVALGCVVRGETEHFSLVSEQCYRGLQEVSLRYSIPLGVGVLACDSLEQALARADTQRGIDCGGQALRACCGLMSLRQGFKGK